MEELFVRVRRRCSALLVEMAAVLVVAYGAIEAFIRLLGVIVPAAARPTACAR